MLCDVGRLENLTRQRFSAAYSDDGFKKMSGIFEIIYLALKKIVYWQDYFVRVTFHRCHFAAIVSLRDIFPRTTLHT